jgi:glycosyltransferase involved in cell wall biosynthesis
VAGPSTEAPTTLLLVGDTLFSRADGRWCTLAALSKQLDVWFAEFDRVVIAACLLPGPPPDHHRALERDDLEFHELPVAGGTNLRAKLGVALTMVRWAVTLVPLMRRTTAVHLRTPCNVTILAIPLARLLVRRRYAIYADNWEPLGVEARTFRLQRWLLRHLFGGVVHAYTPPGEHLPRHVRVNTSPSFTQAELDAMAPAAQRRAERLTDVGDEPRELRVCIVGNFRERKNQAGLIRAVAVLRNRGVPVRLRLAGTGQTFERDRALAAQLGLDDHAEFLGHVGHDRVLEVLEWADVNALVSAAEGFGKVFLEGMAVGCPAVCGPGDMQRWLIGDGARGRQADPRDPAAIADALEELWRLPAPARLRMSASCREFAGGFTTEAFAAEIDEIVHGVWALPRPATGTRRGPATGG